MHSTMASSVTSANTNAQYRPPSPTLSDPDMILPYNDHEISVPMGLMTGNSIDVHIDLKSNTKDSLCSSDLSLIAPRTPIIYGTGTILSDIGEVTEVEGTSTSTGQKTMPVVKKLLKQPQNNAFSRSKLSNTSVMFRKRAKSEYHQRRTSIESISTVASDEQYTELFQDIEGDLSVDESVFQGDDEESIIHSDSEDEQSDIDFDNEFDNDDKITLEARRPWERRDSCDYNEPSSAALSRRAELILLNAKRRLNTMEGNLNRARTSIIHSQGIPIAPSHIITPFNLSTPSFLRYNSQKSQKLKSFSSIVKKLETKPEFNGIELVKPSGYTDKALSKCVSSTGIQSQFLDQNEKPSLDPSGLLNRRNDNTGLELGLTQRMDHIREDHNQLGNVRVLTRSASSLQMRDIQYQVQGLKGKLSILRERTKNDSLRRRSLQSLKISTPFTVAEKFQFDENTHRPIDEPTSRMEFSLPHTNNFSEIDSATGELLSESSLQYSSNKTELDNELNFAACLDNSANKLNFEAALEEKNVTELCDREDTDDSGSEASFYYDTAVSHEDREDAFDYEHFFLHSAMGTIGQQRRSSYSSEESVETTRGISTSTHSNPLFVDDPTTHIRSSSTDSLSTMASFETAVEISDSENVMDNENENDEIGNFAAQPKIVNHSFKNQIYRYNQGLTPKSSVRSFRGDGHKIRFSITTDMPGRKLYKARLTIHEMQSDSSSMFQSEPKSLIGQVPAPPNEDNNRIAAATAVLSPSSVFPADLLSQDDQNLVQRLVNSVGECILSLHETGMDYDVRVWRRRVDAARRVLEGDEGAL